MTGIIQLLPDHIANQIAAGEVIQRPSSVVKELVENAIDAGATNVKIIIKDAGKTLIQVIDNGKGMSAQDALLCFDRHATSKVKSADDLFQLTTKGFRGEALASIAAIAHVTLKTKMKDLEIGSLVQIEGSKVILKEETICADGTSFEVKNLFYNVPARRNFLKSDNVEFNHIKDEFERIAIPHPEIGLQLIHNEQEIYHLLPSNTRKRIVDILGKNSNDKLVPIDENTDIVKIHGFVGKPEFAKRTRGEQFFFVNQRFFKDSYFNHAVNKAFESLILDKCFPSYFLFLEINPEKIDVNVHPTKTEIKFEEDKLIYSILFSSIRQALGKYNISPTLDFEQEQSFDLPYDYLKQPIVEPTIKVNPTYNPFINNTSRSSSNNYKGNGNTQAIKNFGFESTSLQGNEWENFYPIEEEIETAPQTLDLELKEDRKAYLIKHPFILTSSKSGFLIIHIQRAVERIIYDEFMQSFLTAPIESQTLLFPIEKKSTKNEAIQWQENGALIKQLGFNFAMQEDEIIFDAVPAILDEKGIHHCFDLINEALSVDQLEKGDIAHHIILQIAKSASNSKKINQNEEAQHLIDQLFACEEHVYSPSKKKIMDNLALTELTQKF